MNEKFWLSIQISLKFVPKGPKDKNSALFQVQVMAWRRTGNKPLPETMLTQFTDVYMRHWGGDELKEGHVTPDWLRRTNMKYVKNKWN